MALVTSRNDQSAPQLYNKSQETQNNHTPEETTKGVEEDKPRNGEGLSVQSADKVAGDATLVLKIDTGEWQEPNQAQTKYNQDKQTLEDVSIKDGEPENKGVELTEDKVAGDSTLVLKVDTGEWQEPNQAQTKDNQTLEDVCIRDGELENKEVKPREDKAGDETLVLKVDTGSWEEPADEKNQSEVLPSNQEKRLL